MPVVKITGQGLSAIALSVALLWGCWMEQRAVARRDLAERVRLLREIELLRNRRSRPEPAFHPPRPSARNVTWG